ncbi:sporulation-delaying protein SdpB family protein [uncultured Maribacter sp.]|uniref:sporulation-delaying protein SdpB family protein n=1 Tax=uncultured Maribacter sp. TaxID=431308 RepID=UPI0026104268|nr:sporulation-delaying protein SdpB family protein [uncultured Maribacter sp.]
MKLLQKKNNNLFFSELNPFTWVYGLGRTLIALSLLITFVFTDVNILFDSNIINSLGESNLLHNRINLFGIIGYENLYWSKIIVILILILVMLGTFPRITGIFHFWVFHSFHNACIYLDGGDQIGTILTALLIPITLLDSRNNHWKKSNSKPKDFTMFLGRLFFIIISVQIAFIYFHTGIEKIYKLNEWVDGTAMYYILQGKYFGLNNLLIELISPFLKSKYIYFLTWWVILSHLTLSFALFLKRNDKIIFFLLGITLHIGIAILMGLYSFSLVMLGALVLYLLPFNLKKISW